MLARSFLLALLSVSFLAAGETDADLAFHEKILMDAGILREPAALLKLFRDRTPDEELKARLGDLVRRLGDRSYRTRARAEEELIRAGKLALPLLRPALKEADIEAARRAERCIAAIESNGDNPLLSAAARVLASRKAQEAVEVLLAYVPATGDEQVIESIHHALGACGLREGKPIRALSLALEDREPSRRLAATVAIAGAAEKELPALRARLTDTEPPVRLEAGIGLLRLGDREAFATLLRIMSDAPLSLASRAEEILAQVAGESGPTAGLSAEEATRRTSVSEWEKWWKKHAQNIDWKKVHAEPPSLGLTLVCEAHLPNGGRVFECGSDGKPRWNIDCNNPLDAQMLPGGRVLIADCHGGKVFEADRTGKVHWTHSCPSPVSVQRLPGGNTLIASHSEIQEVTREGSKVYSFQRQGYVYYARKMRNGVIVVVSADGVLAEVDTTGKELMRLQVGGMGNWAGVEVLPGGRYLVARAGANEVAEIDRSGKVLWQVSVRNPNSATRLRNGHTLVSSHDEKCVLEFDRSGKVVWKRMVEGNTFRSRRR